MGIGIKKIFEKISKSLNFSQNDLFDDLSVSIFSGEQVVLNGYSKIIEFDSNMIVVARKKDHVVIYGSNLKLSELEEESIIIEGKVKSIEF